MDAPVTLALVTRIAAITARNRPREAAYRDLLTALRTAPGYDAATLYCIDGDGELREAVQVGDNPVRLLSGALMDLADGPAAWLSRQTRPLVIPVLGVDQEARGYASFLGLPLREGERCLGMLNLGHRTPGHFRREYVDAYQAVAVQCSLLQSSLLRAAVTVSEPGAAAPLPQDPDGSALRGPDAPALRRPDAASLRPSSPNGPGGDDPHDPTVERLIDLGRAALDSGARIKTPLTHLEAHLAVLPGLVETRNQRHLKRAARELRELSAELRGVLGRWLPE